MKSITAIGSVALDSLVLPCGEFPDVLGGSASHFATSCAHFNNQITIVGVVGKDFPQEHVDYFQKRDIDTSGLVFEDGETFRWKGEYKRDEMDEAITLDTRLNVFESFSPQLTEEQSKSDILFLGNIHPALQLDVVKKTSAKLKLLDTMNLWIHNTREKLLEAISLVDVFIFNETEAKVLTGEESLIAAGRKVLTMGPKIVVIKKGSNGALLVSADDLFMIPSYPIMEVVDPTGAGDSFAGGFVGYLSECEKLDVNAFRNAVVYGNIMGSYNVQAVGVNSLANVSREQIDQRFAEFKDMVSF